MAQVEGRKEGRKIGVGRERVVARRVAAAARVQKRGYARQLKSLHASTVMYGDCACVTCLVPRWKLARFVSLLPRPPVSFVEVPITGRFIGPPAGIPGYFARSDVWMTWDAHGRMVITGSRTWRTEVARFNRDKCSRGVGTCEVSLPSED